MTIYRLSLDDSEDAHLLSPLDRQNAIVTAAFTDDYLEWLWGKLSLAAWYTDKPHNVLHELHDLIVNNPAKKNGTPGSFPWWWKHPLTIENARANRLCADWNHYHKVFPHYRRPYGKIKLLTPLAAPDNWEYNGTQFTTDWGLVRAWEIVAFKEDPDTRFNKAVNG